MLYSRKFLIKRVESSNKKKRREAKSHHENLKMYHYRDWRNILKFHENKHKILTGQTTSTAFGSGDTLDIDSVFSKQEAIYSMLNTQLDEQISTAEKVSIGERFRIVSDKINEKALELIRVMNPD